MSSGSTSTGCGPPCSTTSDVLRRQRVRRTRSGSIKVDIPAPEQEVLRHVLPQLRDLLTL